MTIEQALVLHREDFYCGKKKKAGNESNNSKLYPIPLSKIRRRTKSRMKAKTPMEP